jgi:hypothetical protein
MRLNLKYSDIGDEGAQFFVNVLRTNTVRPFLFLSISYSSYLFNTDTDFSESFRQRD